MNIHASAATHGAEGDCQTPVAEIATGISSERERSCRLARCRGVQRQAGIASGSLAIYPRQGEVLWSDAPDCRSVTGMKTIDRAPDVGRGSAIIHEECVCPATARKEV
jgi:hypothetical protein